MYKIIDGKAIANHAREKIKLEVNQLKQKNINPCLAVILVGDNQASKVYVNNKKKACKELGITSEEYLLDATVTQEELLSLINQLNSRSDLHGILVQLPLPKHIDEELVIASINPNKDVDAFHNLNVGKIMTGKFSFLPCTPSGIMELLDHENIDIEGKHCIVIGRSNIVGKPMAMLLLHKNATVTICHSKTQDIAKFTKMADIIIVAVGRAKFLTREMIKPGAIVIDVGMNRDENGKLCGDVDFEGVKETTSYITPVPGGVGPMTITMLMQNTVTAAKLNS